MNEAILALLFSVAMHVTWNLLARQQPPRSYPLWWVLLVHLILLGPWGFYSLLTQVDWSWQLVMLLSISACANALYFFSLKKAYDYAPVALVYPLVRSSPLLIAIWSSLFFGVTLSAGVWFGILISVAGLLLLAASGNQRNDAYALLWSIVAMVNTSVYSLSDKAATLHIPTFGALVGYISCGYLLSWLTLTLLLRSETGSWWPTQRLNTPVLLIGGLCVGLSYALIIHAMRFMSAAEAVGYTNGGIVVASLISLFIFRERTRWPMRLSGALIICSGLFVMAFVR